MDSSVNTTSAAPPVAPPAARAPGQAAGNALPASGNAGGNELPPVAAPSPPPERVEQAIAQIQDYLSDARRQLHFEVDPANGRTIVRVINPETGEVVRQIPGDEVLQLAAAIGTHGGQVFSDLA